MHRFFFILLLILLPTQLGIHFWPDWASVLGRRVDYLSPTIYLTDIIIFFVLSIWFIEWSSQIKNYEFRIKNIRTFLHSIVTGHFYLILFIGLYVFVNIWNAINQPVAIYKWVKLTEFGLLGWYIIKTKPSFSTVITPLSVGVLYSSVLATAQFVFQHSIGGPLWFLGERTFTIDTPGISRIALNWSLGFGHWDFGLKLRPYATFPHPNVLGGYLVVILPLIFNELIRPIQPITQSDQSIKSRVAGSGFARQFNNSTIQQSKTSLKLEKVYYGVVTLLSLVALGFTFSRSAWTVGAGVSILYYGVWLKTKNSYSVFTIIRNTIPIILLVLVILKAYPFIGESVIVRQQLNASALILWKSSPLIGVGLGNFLVQLPKALPSRTIYFLQPVHNIYFLVLAETGVVGFALFALLLWKWVKGLVLCIADMKIKRIFYPLISYHFSLIILLLIGLVDHYPFTLQQGQLLLTLALSFSLSLHDTLHDRVQKN
ncbi:O-antigen ligase family protein [Candidatus Gottesmanbacteria bacterium]|nr:O-antigen ligase family protein [Candidatus Gottesmanbacteria bacterium]